jgi:uncharacterized OB-fold protein
MAAEPSGRPPIADEHSRAYWDAAAAGRLLIQRCSACGHLQFYPRRHCTACFAPDPDWQEARGTGRLHTFSVIHRTPNPEFAGECPYVFAVVELDEGVRMSTRIVDTPHDRLACDAPVRVVFTERSGGVTLPTFTLDQEQG